MTEKYEPGTAPPPWRVGEFWSSADPRMVVLMLAVGSEVSEYQRHRDFIRWVSPITITPAGAKEAVRACHARQTGPDLYVCACGGPPCVPCGVMVGPLPSGDPVQYSGEDGSNADLTGK